MTSIKTYDPREVLVTIAGQIISGFEPGTFLTVTPDQAPFSDDYGVDGEAARWKPSNPFDTLTLTLRMSALSNEVLSNLHLGDLATNSVVVPVLIQDLNSAGAIGPTTLVAARAWINGPPPVQYGDSPLGRQWTIRMLNTLYNIMGIPVKDVLTSI